MSYSKNKTLFALAFDLDGCLSDDRLRLADYEAGNYDAYHSSLSADQAMNTETFFDLICAVQERIGPTRTVQVIFVTGRPERYREKTELWLSQNSLAASSHTLLMRPDDNLRCGTAFLKTTMLQNYINDFKEISVQYRLLAAFDNRDDVLTAYRLNGFPAFKLDYDGLSHNKTQVIASVSVAAREILHEMSFEAGSPRSVVQEHYPPNPVDEPPPSIKDAQAALTQMLGAVDSFAASGEDELALDCEAKAESTSAADLLVDMADTYRERNKVYGDNYKSVGKLMAILFPDGVSAEILHSDQFHLFELILVKLSRYANSNLKHKDSIHDAGVYAAMCEACIKNKGES